MAETKRWIAVAVILTAASLSYGVAAEAGPRIVLHIDDRVSVPARELAVAKTVVERTFEAVGVEIVWAEDRFPTSITGPVSDRAAERHLAVMLVNGEESTDAATLGVAAPKLAVAYVFYNRIAHRGRKGPIDLGVVFGRVITHEVGHLLLPTIAHSAYGIMRADMDLGYSNPNRFTDDEAQTIRAAIASRPTGNAVCSK